jgi:hypothetical protein
MRYFLTPMTTKSLTKRTEAATTATSLKEPPQVAIF